MKQDNLWCGYCGTQEFIHLERTEHLRETWECTNCHAGFEDNPGYGYFTSWPGSIEQDLYCLSSGELLDNSKLPRTPEGIVRYSSSRDELQSYLDRTQIK